MSQTHASLSPRAAIMGMAVYFVAAGVLFSFVGIKVAVPMAFIGAGLGVICGLLQHLSIAEAPEKFKAATTALEIRRAFSSTVWGYRYLWWLYICKTTLALAAILLIRNSVLKILAAYFAGYALLMLVRELVTLRDAFRLAAVRQTDPVGSSVS